jgi:hypothetical protein
MNSEVPFLWKLLKMSKKLLMVYPKPIKLYQFELNFDQNGFKTFFEPKNHTRFKAFKTLYNYFGFVLFSTI